MSSPTLAELKRVYESGEKTTKIRQKKIDAQLKRKCTVPKCSNSLAFKYARAKFCDDHRGSGKSLIRTYNRKKKARYDAKHGTGRKTIKRNVEVKKFGVKYDPSITLLYEDYKEPLTRVDAHYGKNGGYGYMGTLALTEDRQLVQCHICGNLFPSVGLHLRAHKISARQYKEHFGLALGTALIGEGVRKNLQELVVEKAGLKGRGLPKHLEGYNEKFKSGEIKRRKRGDYSLEWRNKNGLCPEQVLEKILDLKEKLGYTPGIEEFQAEYGGRYMGSIQYLHGSWSNAVKKLGLQTREELRRINPEKLLQELVEFKAQYDRIPMTSDFNRGMLSDKAKFIRAFGTLNNARIAAGMNAVIAMPFGQIMELTPAEYEKYQAGHKIEKISDAAYKKRLRRKAKREREKLYA